VDDTAVVSYQLPQGWMATQAILTVIGMPNDDVGDDSLTPVDATAFIPQDLAGASVQWQVTFTDGQEHMDRDGANSKGFALMRRIL